MTNEDEKNRPESEINPAGENEISASDPSDAANLAEEDGKDASSIEEEFEDNPYSQLTKHIRRAREAQKEAEQKAAELEKERSDAVTARSTGQASEEPSGQLDSAIRNSGETDNSQNAADQQPDSPSDNDSRSQISGQPDQPPVSPGQRMRVIPKDDDFDEEEDLERKARISAARLSSAHAQKAYAPETSEKGQLSWESKAAIGGGVIVLALILLWAFFVRPGTISQRTGGGSESTASGTNNGMLLTGMTEGETGGALPSEDQELALADAVPETFSPHSVASTDPYNLIEYTEVEVNGTVLSDISQYQPWYEMNFGVGDTYTDAEGIVTFRGDNFRNSPAYGTPDMPDKTVEGVWTSTTGGLTYNDVSWSGNGWTGQPLMMKWPREVKSHMNMYDSAKNNDDLVEVIYASMDGYIYFLNLETGEYTRDPMYLGWCFKGAGALDPRGYPILYVGAGYDSNEGTSHVFVINLLDCSVMYEFGADDEFSLRGQLSFFDSSALVDAASDTLIYPGENGIIYLIRLGTRYDEAAGTLSVNPSDVVKWRYYGKRTSTSSYWLGMEDSAAIYEGYLFIADNGGNLMCLDLNTLQLVWVQDSLDDSNSTPVLSVEDGHLYLYCSTSFHLGWRSSTTAPVPVWKIDAQTGQILWKTEYECASMDGVSGGVQSTIAVGEHILSDYIYVTVSMTGDTYSGVLACLDKTTGQTVWEHSSAYAWSSPVCIYSQQGSGYVLYCDAGGNLYLLNGLTGDVLQTVSISDGTIEASPAVYNNYVVIGTRACQIWGLKLG